MRVPISREDESPRAQGWFRKSGNVFELARTLQALYRTYRESGQSEGADSCRGEANEIFHRLGRRAEKARAVRPLERTPTEVR